MKKNNFISFVILFICIFFAFTVYADALINTLQEKPNKGQWWINMGYGGARDTSDHKDFGGMTYATSINYMLFQHQLITARYIHAEDLFSANTFTDASLLYGFIAKSKYAYVSASMGLGWAQYDKFNGGFFSPSYHEATYNTVGVPGELQFFVTPFPYFGLGVIVFGNLNNKKSMVGGALAIQLGNLR